MVVDYNKISKTFSNSRKNMKWEEIKYFLDILDNQKIESSKILDIGCGSGRLLGELLQTGYINSSNNYLGVDYSDQLLIEAQKAYPEYNFICSDMRKISEHITEKYDVIFFIASFHHLESEQDRLDVLEKCSSIIKEGGYIFMTNWWLDSQFNFEKYQKSQILSSKNQFGNFDYSIKIGEYNRYYHGFSTEELEYLFKKQGLNIIENRGFSNNRNIISILQK